MTPLQRKVLDWAERHRRDLPWRATRDPWSVLVSEVMLQQTPVARVLPRWAAFLARWPDTAACAAASSGDVVAEWHGLGYPRRARNLHRCAVRIEGDLGGRFPADLDALLTLEGVGPYTARAVLAFAFEADAAVVDTNVGRVLARVAGERLTPAVAQRAADDWLPPGRAWEWNQALLDLGAGVCRPRDPDCARCPMTGSCSWARAGRPDPDPAVSSAAVSRRQAPYRGSRREARGAVLAAARSGPVDPSAHDPEVVGSLLDDELVELDDLGRVVLVGGVSPRGTPPRDG